MESPKTRLAPSPTGALHLGNARTFLLNWLLARRRGWRVLLRMEDLDGPRVKAGAAKQAVEDLRWLGLDWDEVAPAQSTRGEAYRSALEQLSAAGAPYPCICTRRDVLRAASAPHGAAADGPAYPGACRGRFGSADEAQRRTGRPPAWRVRVEDTSIVFNDTVAGPQTFDLTKTCGDFVIFRSEGLAAYQLAVVIDDDDQGVSEIVRGDDLLESAARQIHLRHLLGRTRPVRYWHLPLVVGADGRRLAKRHGDTRLSAYRRAGVSVERILGLLAYGAGQRPRREEIDLDTLLQTFDAEQIPNGQVVFTNADDRFLRGA
jgi:glutamyl-tRNA synthetase